MATTQIKTIGEELEEGGEKQLSNLPTERKPTLKTLGEMD